MGQSVRKIGYGDLFLTSYWLRLAAESVISVISVCIEDPDQVAQTIDFYLLDFTAAGIKWHVMAVKSLTVRSGFYFYYP